MRTRILVGVVLLLMLVAAAGCSMASVVERYERTPAHAVSTGEGGLDVVSTTTQPFRLTEEEEREYE